MAGASEYLQQGLHFCATGELARAEEVCRQALALDPRLAEAWNLLGVVAHHTGRHELAVRCISQALAIDDRQAAYHFNLGEVYRSVGQADQARSCYAQALQLDPNHAQANNNLGTLHRAAGDVAAAEACYRRALRARPDYAIAHHNLGTVRLRQGDLAGAEACFAEARRLKPDFADAHDNLGAVRLRQGDYAGAEACISEALRLMPNLAAAHYHRGIVRFATGRLAEAEACLLQALRLDPALAEAHYALGRLRRDQLRLTDAQTSLDEALQLRADFPEAWELLGAVLEQQGKLADARTALARATAIRPTDGRKIRFALTFPVIYQSLDQVRSERRRYEDDLRRLASEKLRVTDPVQAIGATPYFLAYQGQNDCHLQAALAGLLVRAVPELQYVAPHCRAGAGRPPGQPLRIGFLSRFFYGHTIAKLNVGFIRNLSRDDFRVFVFRLPGPDDQMAQLIRTSADEAVTLPFDMDAARQQIADRQLDVLFYTDIGMDPWSYFLAFSRLAPVQCVTWGHPVTTGIPTVDYFLSSADLEPADAAEHYTEQLVRMHCVNSYYYEPRADTPPKGRPDFGLDEADHLYVCTQALFKLHPEFDAVLAAILRGDSQGRLVFLQGLHENWERLLRDRLRQSIPDEAARVCFLPRLSKDDFLHLQALADVLLDTAHFGGGNTSYEAFTFGTPVVTLAGPLLRSRITYACYRQMGVMDCVAADPGDFARIALRLGTDPAWRAEVRGRILAAKKALYENAEAVRELEDFFRMAVQEAAERLAYS